MIRKTIMLVAVTLALFIFQGCSSPEAGSGPIRVVVTVQPLADFVERVGGDRVRVAVMVPSGASPHTYEPRPSQLKEVAGADLFVKVGSGVEFELVWMDKLLGVNKKMPVVDSSVGVELIRADEEGEEEEGHEDGDHEDGHAGEEHEGEEHEGEEHAHGAVDPHIWLSPKNAVIMVRNISNGLAAIDPANETYYAENTSAYLAEIDELDRELTEILSRRASRRVMVYHPAWAYLARDYGLVEIGIERGGKQATPAGIASVVRLARENGTRVVFASPEFSTRSAEVVAKEIGARVVLISPLERGYLRNMRRVARALAEE